MKFVLIVGPQAVGKMTVGKALAKITDLTLFHNHMTIELTASVFGRDRPERKELSEKFRMEIFEAVAKSDMPGLIFTLVCAFDLEGEMEYIDKISGIFKKEGGEVYIVELETTLEERLVRNKSELRLEEKPSKRNIEHSEKELLKTNEKYRLNSNPGEIIEQNYLRIDNTNLAPEQVAELIKTKFKI